MGGFALGGRRFALGALGVNGPIGRILKWSDGGCSGCAGFPTLTLALPILKWGGGCRGCAGAAGFPTLTLALSILKWSDGGCCGCSGAAGSPTHPTLSVPIRKCNNGGVFCILRVFEASRPGLERVFCIDDDAFEVAFRTTGGSTGSDSDVDELLRLRTSNTSAGPI